MYIDTCIDAGGDTARPLRGSGREPRGRRRVSWLEGAGGLLRIAPQAMGLRPYRLRPEGARPPCRGGRTQPGNCQFRRTAWLPTLKRRNRRYTAREAAAREWRQMEATVGKLLSRSRHTEALGSLHLFHHFQRK
jgi:hypothetical protein